MLPARRRADDGRGRALHFGLEGRISVFARVTDWCYAHRLEVRTGAGPAGARGGDRRAPGPVGATNPPYVSADDVAVELRGAGPATRQVNNFMSRRHRRCRQADVRRADHARRQLVELPAAPPRRRAGMPRATTRRSTTSGSADGAGLPEGSACTAPTRPTARSTSTWSSTTATSSCVPRGYHGPCVAAPGYPMYYLNVLAGPGGERSMAFCDDPAHHWVRDEWANMPLDPRCPMTTDRGPEPDEALGIGVIGFGWMGQAHSRSYRRVPMLFPDRDAEPRSRRVRRHRSRRARRRAVAVVRVRRGHDDWQRGRGATRTSTPSCRRRPTCCTSRSSRRPPPLESAVFCEKPVGGTPAQTAARRRLPRAAGVITGVGYNYRWAPLVQYAQPLIAERRARHDHELPRPLLLDVRQRPDGAAVLALPARRGRPRRQHRPPQPRRRPRPLPGRADRPRWSARRDLHPRAPTARPAPAATTTAARPATPPARSPTRTTSGCCARSPNGAVGTFESSPHDGRAGEPERLRGVRHEGGAGLEPRAHERAAGLPRRPTTHTGYTTVFGGERFPSHGNFVPGRRQQHRLRGPDRHRGPRVPHGRGRGASRTRRGSPRRWRTSRVQTALLASVETGRMAGRRPDRGRNDGDGRLTTAAGARALARSPSAPCSTARTRRCSPVCSPSSGTATSPSLGLALAGGRRRAADLAGPERAGHGARRGGLRQGHAAPPGDGGDLVDRARRARTWSRPPPSRMANRLPVLLLCRRHVRQPPARSRAAAGRALRRPRRSPSTTRSARSSATGTASRGRSSSLQSLPQARGDDARPRPTAARRSSPCRRTCRRRRTTSPTASSSATVHEIAAPARADRQLATRRPSVLRGARAAAGDRRRRRPLLPRRGRRWRASPRPTACPWSRRSPARRRCRRRPPAQRRADRRHRRPAANGWPPRPTSCSPSARACRTSPRGRGPCSATRALRLVTVNAARLDAVKHRALAVRG